MQPFFSPESMHERNAQVAAAAEFNRRHSVESRGRRLRRWRRGLGWSLVSIGERLIPAPSDPGCLDTFHTTSTKS